MKCPICSTIMESIPKLANDDGPIHRRYYGCPKCHTVFEERFDNKGEDLGLYLVDDAVYKMPEPKRKLLADPRNQKCVALVLRSKEKPRNKNTRN